MIKSFGKRVLFSVPQTIVIYSMFKLLKGFEKQTIRNFQEPISFLLLVSLTFKVGVGLIEMADMKLLF